MTNAAAVSRVISRAGITTGNGVHVHGKGTVTVSVTYDDAAALAASIAATLTAAGYTVTAWPKNPANLTVTA